MKKTKGECLNIFYDLQQQKHKAFAESVLEIFSDFIRFYQQKEKYATR